MATLIRTDRNGTKYYEGLQDCPRCSGKGVYIIGVCNGNPVLSPVDNGVCFQCLGSGKVTEKWKEYTPEYEQKLEERREKRRQKYLEEHKEEIERARQEREEQERIKAEEKARREKEIEERERAEQERKANSNYVGNVGDKLEQEFIYNFSAYFEMPSFGGYGMTTMYIHNLSDKDGNTFTWKTANSISIKDKDSNEWIVPEKGDIVTLKGTIKEHSEYKEEKQTVLTRCKILDIKSAS